MLNYIHADIKRILTQKKFIKFGLILLLLFEALIFLMNTHNFTSSRYLTIIAMSLEFMPLVIGIFIFSIVLFFEIGKMVDMRRKMLFILMIYTQNLFKQPLALALNAHK